MATREYKFWQGETIFHRHVPERLWQSGGISRAIPIGNLLRSPKMEVSLRALSQSALYCGSNLQGLPPANLELPVWAMFSSMHEIIHRGVLAPVAPEVDDYLINKRVQGDWKFRRENGVFSATQPKNIPIEKAIAGYLFNRNHSAVYPINYFEDKTNDSESAEAKCWERIHKEWPALASYAHPQVYLSNLLETGDKRRADILLCPPLQIESKQSKGIVLEIHGSNKGGTDQQTELSAQRKKKEDLEKAGWEVIDIPREEINKRHAPWTKRLSALQKQASSVSRKVSSANHLLDGSWISAQVDLLMIHMLSHGISREENQITNIIVPPEHEQTVKITIQQFKRLLRGLESLWDIVETSSPFSENFESNLKITSEPSEHATYWIRIDPDQSSYLDCKATLHPNEMLVRRICLPCNVDVAALPVSEQHVEKLLFKLVGIRPNLQAISHAQLSDYLQPALQRIFSKEKFRDGQIPGIHSALDHTDRLILLPAGHGKSLIFQLSALLLPGVTLVVEPLRALLDDQILGLQDAGISRCAKIHADHHNPGEIDDANIIYIAPERLYVTTFDDTLSKLVNDRGLDLLVVDEAHSVSECGHSFRTAYLGFRDRVLQACKQSKIKHAEPTTLCLTATAVHIVVRDLLALMGLNTAPVSLANKFAKTNLTIETVPVPLNKKDVSMKEALTYVLKKTKELDRTLIFCNSRGKWTQGGKHRARWYGVEGTVDVVNGILTDLGRTDEVTYYHGQLEADHKSSHARQFINGDKNIMISTKAFGTGIDVSNVRNVIHVGTPEGLEAWYQESGRAGRDNKPAKAFILADLEGEELQDLIIETAATDNQNALKHLRTELAQVKDQGSFSRQMFMLLGRAGDIKSSVINMEKPLPDRKRLASFPGWALEHKAYNLQILNQVFASFDSKGFYLAIKFHSDHDNMVWKTIHRLKILNLIEPSYERTYYRKRPNNFNIVVVKDLENSTAPEKLKERIIGYTVRLLGSGIRKRLEKRLNTNEKDKDGIYSLDVATRISAAMLMLVYTTYEAVRKIRIDSFKSLNEFLRIDSPDDQRAFLNKFISTNPEDIEFINALAKDTGNIEDWETWLYTFNQPELWISKRGLLAQARNNNLTSALPDFLQLSGDLRTPRYFDLKESTFHAIQLVNNQDTKEEARLWAFGQLMEINQKLWLDVVEQVFLHANSTSTEDSKANQSFDLLAQWALGQPEVYGTQPAIHLATVRYIQGAIG